MATAAESTRDAMPDYLWMADDPDEGHCWFAAPDADAAMVQARRECIGYFDQAHVARMVITVWDAVEDGEEIGVIEVSMPAEKRGNLRASRRRGVSPRTAGRSPPEVTRRQELGARPA